MSRQLKYFDYILRLLYFIILCMWVYVFMCLYFFLVRTFINKVKIYLLTKFRIRKRTILCLRYNNNFQRFSPSNRQISISYSLFLKYFSFSIQIFNEQNILLNWKMWEHTWPDVGVGCEYSLSEKLVDKVLWILGVFASSWF